LARGRREIGVRAWWWLGGLVGVLLLGAGAAAASPVTLEGLTFSDEEGGFVIRGGSGRGTVDQPFVIREDITEEGPAVLVIRGLRASFGNRAGAPAATGFVLVKVIRNRTTHAWQSLALELRELKGERSTYEDGLSFDQSEGKRRRIASDRFTEMIQNDEPRDEVLFSGAVIRPGETVTVRTIITDYSPVYEFYLFQRRDSPLAFEVSQPGRELDPR
jgi:hypothetical protein